MPSQVRTSSFCISKRTSLWGFSGPEISLFSIHWNTVQTQVHPPPPHCVAATRFIDKFLCPWKTKLHDSVGFDKNRFVNFDSFKTFYGGNFSETSFKEIFQKNIETMSPRKLYKHLLTKNVNFFKFILNFFIFFKNLNLY